VSETQPPAHYEITVEGILAPHWSAWFDGLQLASDGGRTILTGPVADQAALHGLLAKIRDLGLPLLAVRRTEPLCQTTMASCRVGPVIMPAATVLLVASSMRMKLPVSRLRR